MQMNKKIMPIILISMVIISIQYADTASSVGVIPAKINMSNLLKGSSYTRSIRLFGGETPVFYNLNATGDIEEWVNFYKDSNLTEPIQNITVFDRQEIFITFTIPEDISNGDYRGTLYAEISDVGEKENLTGSVVILSFPIQISLGVVGVQILTGNVTEIKTRDVEVGQPLSIKVDFLNTGNVIATPNIKVNITRENWPISEFTYSDTDVDVDSGDLIDVQWDTINRESGSYTASITVTLGGDVIAEKTLLFDILPRGTFTRKGEIKNLSYTGDLTEGSTLLIQALFKNTGQVETPTRFIAEVYRNGILDEILEGAEQPVLDIQETYLFTTYFIIKNSGSYELRCYVAYENNKTAVHTLSFNVNGLLENAIPVAIAIVIGIVGIGIIYFLLKKRNIETKKDYISDEGNSKVRKRQKSLRLPWNKRILIGQHRPVGITGKKNESKKKPKGIRLPWNKRVRIMWGRPEGAVTSSKMFADSKYESDTTKEETIRELSSLNGISTDKANLLYDNGFNSLEKLGSASVDDLLKIKGIDEKFVEDVKDQLKTKMDK